MGKRVLTIVLLTLFFVVGCDVGSDDDKKPSILETLPTDSSVDVIVNSSLSITFSEAMNKELTEKAFSISPNHAGTPDFNWSGNTMTVSFNKRFMTHTVYTCQVSKEAKNAKKKRIAQNYDWSFVTEQTTSATASSDIRLDKASMGNVWYFNDIATNGNNVYYVWADSRNGNYDVYFNMSEDAGETWLTTDVKLNTNAAGTSASSGPTVKCYGDNVYVCWSDDRNGLTDIYFIYSHDGGKTWNDTDMRINKDGAGAATSSNGNLACSGNHVYMAWYDDRNGVTTDVYFNYSEDGGITWQTQDKRINTNTIGASSSTDVRLCAVDEHVYVEWVDDRNGLDTDIYFNSSNDYGATWGDSDIRIDTDPAGSAQNWRPNMACDGDNVVVAWTDYRNGGRDIYANFSNDNGKTWQANDIRIDSDTTNADSWWPYLDVSGDNFYIVWNDGRNGDDDIYFNCSHDAGATWLQQDMRIEHDAGPGQFKTFRCKVLATGKAVYTVWQDNRNGYNDIFMNFSTDGGYTWQANDIRLDTDTPGAAGSQRPQMAICGGNAYVGWMDDRNGMCLYFNYLK